MQQRIPTLKLAAYAGGLLGLTLLTVLVVRSDFAAMWATIRTAGWSLLWLPPYRLLYFILYAIGWRALLRPYDPNHRAGLGYLFWVTTVREGIDRLLPVASVGGGFAGVRLVGWRGIGRAPAAATVATEVLLSNRHDKRSYRLTGPAALLPADRARILGEVLGRSIELIAESDDDARRRMAESMPEPMVDSFFQFFRRGGYDEGRSQSNG